MLALAVGALGTWIGYLLLRIATGDLGGDNTWLKLFALGMLAVAVVVLTRSLPQLLWGLLDLFGSRRVEGTVLRARTRTGLVPNFRQTDDKAYVRYFVALDDGRSTKLTAYRVNAQTYEELSQGAEAKLEVTPNLGYVRRPSA